MKKLFYIIGVICVVSFFTACTTVQHISFERLQAAAISYPDAVRKVGVVNAMPKVGLNEKKLDYSSSWLEGDGKIATETLSQEIASSNYFDLVVVCDSSLRGDDVPLKEDYLLSKSVVDSLILSLGVDMLFVFERVYIQLSESTSYSPELMTSVPALDGVVTPVLRSYIAGRETPLFMVSESDTICWEYTSDLSVENIVKDASGYAASMPMEYLLPHWKEIHRFYFDGGNVVMRDAGVYVREQNWEEAAALWQRIYEQKKGKSRMRVAFNLALYYELKDNYEKAMEYIDEASRLSDEGSSDWHLIEFYRQQLKQQASKFVHLNVQMSRFN